MNLSKKQLGFALPLVILIAVVLIIAGGTGYYFYKNSQEQKEAEWVEPEQAVDETADWKVYRDIQNEWYEIKYPPNWRVQSSTVGLGSTVTFYDSGTSVFKVWAAPNWDSFVVEEWWDEKDRQDEMTYIKKDPITIDGVKALVFQATTGPKEEHFVFTKRAGIYDISAVADRKIIKQILSTFKFIEKGSEAFQPPKEEIIEITGRVNAIDERIAGIIELVSEDGSVYVLQTHPILVWVFDLSHIQKKDYLEFIKGTRDVMERRASLWGIPKILVRIAQFSTQTKLIIAPMIDPADLAENFIDEFRKLISKAPFLEFRLEREATGLTGKHLMRAQLDFNPKTNKPVINLGFNNEGKQIFEEFTTKNIGKELAIYLDGTSIYSFIIQSSTSIITGDFIVDEVKQLVRFLNVGAMPVPIYPVSHQNKIDMEELRKLQGKTIWVKGYLSEKEAIKKTIYVISFNVK